MHVYIQILLIAAAITAVLIFMMVRNNRRRKKTFLAMFRRKFGHVSEREYGAGEIERISHYFRRQNKDRFYIDDITWNDLDMDRIFMLVNHTLSSPGEDYLYKILREPAFQEEELQERDRLIEFFRTHQAEREELQFLLLEIGRNRFASLSDLIFTLDSAPVIPLKSHIVILVLLLLSVAGIFIKPVVGVIAFFFLSMGNIIYYFAGKNKKIIELYVSCFECLSRILNAADKIEKLPWPEISVQTENIRKSKSAFKGYRKKALWIAGKNEATSDNPAFILMEYIRMLFHVDYLMFNRVVREIRDKKEELLLLLDNIGELDAMISTASFREELPFYCKPQFLQKGEEPVSLHVEDLYHPLIEEPVANSMTAVGGILVTGSNASGKSTFLKNMAINCIMAQTLDTCPCSVYRAPFLKVMTSMALRDDLGGGESYFIVEIKSLKRILDESEKEEPLLCIIDEVLRGTNTIERIAASSRILDTLAKPWMLPFAATHDIELSYILEGIYTNYHFEEEIGEKDVIFNYLLKKGRATTRNAIRLLEVCGYDEKIAEEARKAAQYFEETNHWQNLGGEKTCL